jgi:hypothetical protein
MNKFIHRSITQEIRHNLSFEEKWRGKDQGLITCWEVGRKRREADPELAAKAENNELPVLNWKGGTDKKLSINEKYGSLNYLAQWQGLRGEDLNVNLDNEVVIMCAKTKMLVTYTPDIDKISPPDE